MRALDDLRVVELCEEIAGPYCTKLLADLGAEVIKVEGPHGDVLRRWSGKGLDQGEPGGLFEYLNTSKGGVTLDFNIPAHQEDFESLIAEADLLVESSQPGRELRRPFSLDQLLATHPRLSVVSISPFGLEGSHAKLPATEFTLQAYAGSIVRGPENEPPLQAGGRLGEWAAGTFAALAAVVAVEQARRIGTGVHVDLSMLECMALTFNPFPSVLRSFLGTDHPGERKREIPCISEAKDGWVGFCTVTGEQWENFCLLIGRADLLEDDGLRTWLDRVRRFDEVSAIIDAWTTVRTVDEIVREAEAFRVPAVPIGTGSNVSEFDHFKARGVFTRNPTRGFLQPRSPLLLSDSPPRPFDPAPAFGAKAAWTPSSSRVPPETALVGRNDSDDGPIVAPLAGLRVVDFTAFWAGPTATQFLASMGADVLKIESVQRPDAMRYNSVSSPADPLWYEKSPIFHGANLNKRSITLDLSQPRGRELLLRLIASADVMIENFTPRVIERFELGYERLRKVNPRLVMVRMPAFGLDGPWRDRGGFAQTMEQVSGMASVSGKAEGPLMIPSGPCDVFAGTHAALGALAALHQRQRTGLGQLVEVPMVEVALNVAAEPLIEWSRNGVLLGPHGNRGPMAAPQGLYACNGNQDWLAMAVVTDDQWAALTMVLGEPSWASDISLATVDGRRAAHDLIDSYLNRHFAALPLQEAVAGLQEAGIPSAPVVPAGFIDKDPQMRERRFFEPVTHPVMGRHEFPGWPLRCDAFPSPWYRRPAPVLGEHTVEVLQGELSLTDLEIESLRSSKVIGTAPLGSV